MSLSVIDNLQTAPDRPNATTPSSRLTIVDVGGSGGLQPKWLRVAESIEPVLFEPNKPEAEALRAKMAETFPSATVIETGLSNISGTRELNIARYWGCTSLLQPNSTILKGYRIGRAFDVVKTASIECARYDTLYNDGLVPAPEMIKVDVQGFEYQVLQGFGGLLDGCLAIEMETHLYPIYRDQKLLHHMIDFLLDFGFVLRRISPVGNFDGDVVELDVWFTKNRAAWTEFDIAAKTKFSLICNVCGLTDYSRIDPNAAHNQILPEITEGA
jgi:FkbM family methyltransferase